MRIRIEMDKVLDVLRTAIHTEVLLCCSWEYLIAILLVSCTLTVVGEWRNGTPHGYGQLTLSQLSMVFTGYFIEGKRHGYGIQESCEYVLEVPNLPIFIDNGDIENASIVSEFLSAIVVQSTPSEGLYPDQVLEVLVKAKEQSIEDAILSTHVRYMGLWHDDSPQGSCKLVLSNGEVYV